MIEMFDIIYGYFEKSSEDFTNIWKKRGIFDLSHVLLNIDTCAHQWGNLGYWDTLSGDKERLITREHNEYVKACERLATIVYDYAHIYKCPDQMHIIDVGIGCGDQIKMLQRQMHQLHNHITVDAVNISHVQTISAKKRIPACCSNGFCSFDAKIGSGTDLISIFNGETNFADAITAIDTVYHFDKREDFFHQSHHCLKVGGVISFSDICFQNKWIIRILKLISSFLMSIPSANICTKTDMMRSLESAGFRDVTIENITSSVMNGLAGFVPEQKDELKHMNISGSWRKFEISAFFLKWLCDENLMSYVVVKAHKV